MRSFLPIHFFLIFVIVSNARYTASSRLFTFPEDVARLRDRWNGSVARHSQTIWIDSFISRFRGEALWGFIQTQLGLAWVGHEALEEHDVLMR